LGLKFRKEGKESGDEDDSGEEVEDDVEETAH
jgi:hypothetical protein